MKTLWLFFIILVLSANLFAQNETDSITKNEALNVYLNCELCDMAFYKENFTLINYVRDRKVADVQIIVSSMNNGGGGREYMFNFRGTGKYKHLQDTLKFNTKADDTNDEIREKQLEVIKKGLAPFILKTPYASKVIISYEEDGAKEKLEDPWNNWVFRIGGSLFMNGQKSHNTFHSYSNLSASRITEDIKHETFFNYNLSESKYRLYDSNDSLIYSTESHTNSIFLSHSTVLSLGEHWGAGIDLGMWNSSFSNIDLGAVIRPEIEYNFFKYSNASQKQLRIAYSIGAVYRDYTDTTIYNKTTEYLGEQQIEVNFKHITDWGSVRLGLDWSNYLHDFSLYKLGSNASMNLRIFKGFSINFSTYFSMPRNQIGLVKTETTSEDILLRQRELETQYSYYLSMGISYTFGSIYNNVVNPRLD